MNSDTSVSSDDYFAVLERYKFLKNAELPDIPDDHLEHAVMSWMWNQAFKEGLDQYEVISLLPKPCQNVYSCRTVTDEINNGGLNQLFYNETGQFAEMSIEGFLALGAPELSDVMAKAVALYQQSKPVLDIVPVRGFPHYFLKLPFRQVP